MKISRIISLWTSAIESSMAEETSNQDWMSLKALLANTGSSHEDKRYDLVMSWLWENLVPYLQPLADENGYGEQWRNMTEERTANSIDCATDATQMCSNESDKIKAAGTLTIALWRLVSLQEKKAINSIIYWTVTAAESVEDIWKYSDPCALLKKLIEVDNVPEPNV